MSYEDKREQLSDELSGEEYIVTPSRGTLVWDEEAGIAEAEKPEEESAPEAEAPSYAEAPATPEGEVTNTEEATPPDAAYTRFEQDFEKYLGTPLKDAVSLVNELRSFQAQQKVESQKNELRQAWGVTGDEFQSRLTAVQERFSKYSPEDKARLDNPLGAQLIWTQIQAEQGGQRKAVPTLDKSSVKATSASTSKYKYTQAQINKMSNAEYARHAQDIAHAFANGLVKR